MVLQKVVEEKHVEVTDTLIDDNNAIIQVGAPRESLRLLIPHDRGPVRLPPLHVAWSGERSL